MTPFRRPIGWTNAAERDQWFVDLAVSLTGVSLVPFERDGFLSIDIGVEWERAHLTGMRVRVRLESDVGQTGADGDHREASCAFHPLPVA